jgi:uncharacterized protein YjbI with pentapeptide repeats
MSCDINLRRILCLHRAWLRDKAWGVSANLREVKLRGADLCEANLREADLRGADLRGADLRGADLRGADLRGADLRHANLRHANLRHAKGIDLIPYSRGRYRGYVLRCRKRARMGCQEHSIAEWLEMTREQVAEMVDDGAKWYDQYWDEWAEALKEALT